MINLEPLMLSGKEVLPLIEGGKGISITTGVCSGAWAAAGGVGTFSGVNADSFDDQGNLIKQIYHGKTRRERHQELIAYGVQGGINQARTAYERSNGAGRLHMNVLWEAGGTETILRGVLEGARGLIHGVTCGAGMPYKIAEIASEFRVYYYPIISSARAFRALWKRAYHKFAEFLGGVVYEDPWRAGGHNGLSNSEQHDAPQDPLPRVLELRKLMRSCGLEKTPIIMAGGVWFLREWVDWIGSKELGPIAFQFGTRPLLTQESPISKAWKKRLLSLSEGDVSLQRFSPTGFYSSAVRNDFLRELEGRKQRQVAYLRKPAGENTVPYAVGQRGRPVYITEPSLRLVEKWTAEGHDTALKTPESTLIFVSARKAQEILTDQQECMGCLSQCLFSNWSQGESGTNGKKADPRSFCIQKTLQSISHEGSIDDNLMFAGHAVYRFAEDPFYAGGHIPTVAQLVERLQTGD